MARTNGNTKTKALNDALESGRRVRLLIGDRKMRLPGVLVKGDGGKFQLRANWGKTYDVPSDASLKEVEVADGSGRYQPVEA